MFTTVHHVGIITAVLLMAAAMCVATWHRLCIRRPVCTVRSGPLGGLPLSPLLFGIVVLAGLTLAWHTEQPVHPVVALGYPAIGACWFVALWNAQPTVFTDYGIVPEVYRTETAVPWGRIVDYGIAHQDNGNVQFIFLYRAQDQLALARMDVHVPAAKSEQVAGVVRLKLDARFSMTVQDVRREHPSENPKS